MAAQYQLKGGTFVAYNEGDQQGDIIDQALAEAELPPAPEPDWNHPSTHYSHAHSRMEGQDYTQSSSEYGDEYAQSQGPYYQQAHPPPQQQQYYAASSSSNTSQGSPGNYPPIYPSVGQYAASNPAYGSQPAGYEYSQSQGYTHTSASASATLTENEAELKRLRNTAASARFRAKKKKREQSLERQSREKREELQRLENRISELEQENKFLKSLILTPRSSKKDEEEEEAAEEEAAKGKGKEKAHGSGERRGGKGKDGVGTSRH
ncbi:hypothetical protein EG329_012458 [Mollisiaceae sp. DMI_Dod_QoI]|nr:hypothetical protein EG329_012458 [Helotiales sp. DMI_Dod_QoI]